MDQIENKSLSSHKVEINERKETRITGVKKLDSFNEREFMLDSIMGYIQITGTGMALGKMDLENGVLLIKGTINSLKYIGKDKADENTSFWKKVFK